MSQCPEPALKEDPTPDGRKCRRTVWHVDEPLVDLEARREVSPRLSAVSPASTAMRSSDTTSTSGQRRGPLGLTSVREASSLEGLEAAARAIGDEALVVT